MSLRPRPAYGELLKGGPVAAPSKAKKVTAGARDHNEGHLAFVRKLPCLITGKRPVEACHVRFASKLHGKAISGVGTTADDRWTLPMIHSVHMEQHAFKGGERGWWKKIGLDPLVIAMRLWEVSGNVEAGERVIADARAVLGGAK